MKHLLDLLVVLDVYICVNHTHVYFETLGNVFALYIAISMHQSSRFMLFVLFCLGGPLGLAKMCFTVRNVHYVHVHGNNVHPYTYFIVSLVY